MSRGGRPRKPMPIELNNVTDDVPPQDRERIGTTPPRSVDECPHADKVDLGRGASWCRGCWLLLGGEQIKGLRVQMHPGIFDDVLAMQMQDPAAPSIMDIFKAAMELDPSQGLPLDPDEG